eukprot:CAMPEP_0194169460 /NCGR_PEP_ID=MMETSP0154-20130528/4122_1 /TAXON_ID=1049557 /ORGANISM="Thalassiothrix antarctica, Strain L6-D1" /LENGTH=605 /DNA_ID=CAMNT_0038880849 /DNA_START=42 /DNA_END=1859 /DNA_ORIENTATION=-
MVLSHLFKNNGILRWPSLQHHSTKRSIRAASSVNGSNRTTTAPIVNAWTEWGDLKEIVIGDANNACFPPPSPSFAPTINEEGSVLKFDQATNTVQEHYGRGKILQEELGRWPQGKKSQAAIDAANWQLSNLAELLMDRGIVVRRPTEFPNQDWSLPIKTPFFETQNQYCGTCPRDIVATVGNTILESANSRRDRYFEIHQYRQLIREYWRKDKAMMWKAAPKPSLNDESFDEKWWHLTKEERYENMHEMQFCITEDELLFDAADMTKLGQDIFVQLSMTTNKAGIEWLSRELKPQGIRVHTLRFPYDLAPSHIDCTFVPLRPGLILTNPDRPIAKKDAECFRKAGWRFIDAPEPNNAVRPAFSQSSKWLSMNVLSISPTCVVVEEQETNLQALLEKEGFDIITVPFRAVYEFGGGLHCSTWDIRREDRCEDFFGGLSESCYSLQPGSYGIVTNPTQVYCSTPVFAAEDNSEWMAGIKEDTTLARTFSTQASTTPIGYDGLKSRANKSEWTTITEEFDGDRLDIDGHPVMQRWEEPYMAAPAKVAASNGGRVLEVGFWLGLSADAIQSYDTVDEHIVLEANANVFARLEAYAEKSQRPVTPIGPAL